MGSSKRYCLTNHIQNFDCEHAVIKNKGGVQDALFCTCRSKRGRIKAYWVDEYERRVLGCFLKVKIDA